MTKTRWVVVGAALAVAHLLGTGQVSAQSPDKDLNGDGHVDTMTVSRQGGSGYQSIRRCVRDGASGARACVEIKRTAYAPFEAIDTTIPTTMPAALVAALNRPACVPASPSDPTQGAVWALAKPAPAGPTATVVAARPQAHGKPRAPTGVCLRHAQAVALRGAFAWDPRGIARQHHTPGRTILFPRLPAPRLVLTRGRWQLYSLLGAVALYDRTTDRHQWLLSYADGSPEGFKIDRWNRLSKFAATPTSFHFRVHRTSRPGTTVTIHLPTS